jgi:hypothetical protein
MAHAVLAMTVRLMKPSQACSAFITTCFDLCTAATFRRQFSKSKHEFEWLTCHLLRVGGHAMPRLHHDFGWQVIVGRRSFAAGRTVWRIGSIAAVFRQDRQTPVGADLLATSSLKVDSCQGSPTAVIYSTWVERQGGNPGATDWQDSR